MSVHRLLILVAALVVKTGSKVSGGGGLVTESCPTLELRRPQQLRLLGSRARAQ